MLPEGFGAAARAGEPVTVEVVRGDEAGLEADVVLSVVDGVLDQFAASAVAVQAGLDQGVPPDQLGALAQAAADEGQDFELREGQAADEQLDAGASLVAGQAGLFLMFTVSFGVTALLVDRETGTLTRLRSMPVPSWVIVTSKALVSFLLGVVATGVLLLVGGLLFGADFGSPLAVAALVLCVSLAATSVMFLIVRIARTSEQAGIATSIVAVVLGIGGGAFFPVSATGPFSALVDLNPVAALLRGLGITSAGGGLADVGAPVAGHARLRGRHAAGLPAGPGPRGAGMRGLGNVLTVAGVELRLFVRDRSNIFFVFVFPLLLVLMIGSQFGSGASTGRVAVSGGDAAVQQQLVEELEADEVTVSEPGWDAALEQLARGRLDAAVRVLDDSTFELVRGSSANAQVVEQQVRVAVGAVSTEEAQARALEQYGVPADRVAGALTSAENRLSAPSLEVTDVDELSQQFDGLGQFDLGASGQLLLFVFLACLTGATTLIRARRLGVITRMLSGPLSTTQLVAGETLGRWAIGLFQGVYIMVATSLLFDVQWGTLWLSLLVVALFALVAAAAAILLGTLLENEGAAAGVGVGLGLVLAALGGSMLPLELFPDTMRMVADLTPHAWAYEAFAEIQRRGAGLAEVLPQLGVLLAMALGLLLVSSWSLRRSLARAM